MWFIVLPAANLRIRKTDHFPTGAIAIAAVTRVAVIALHGVIQQEIEECRRGNVVPGAGNEIVGLHGVKEEILLLVGEQGKGLAKTRAAGPIDESQAVAIGAAPAVERAAELNIDVVDDAGPVRSGIVIGRD